MGKVQLERRTSEIDWVYVIFAIPCGSEHKGRWAVRF